MTHSHHIRADRNYEQPSEKSVHVTCNSNISHLKEKRRELQKCQRTTGNKAAKPPSLTVTPK